MIEDQYRIENRGYKTPCWIILRVPNSNGNTRLHIGRQFILGHRYFYEKFKGPIPDGLEIDHLCRVRNCVNPDHLEAVTRAINVQRGRNSILTREDVYKIKGHIASGMQPKLIARLFRITTATVSNIKNGHTWKD